MKTPTAGFLAIADLPPVGGGTCPVDGRQVTPFPYAAVVAPRGSTVARVCDSCAGSILGPGADEALRGLNLLLAAVQSGRPTLRAALIGALRPLLTSAMADVIDQALVHLLAQPAAA